MREGPNGQKKLVVEGPKTKLAKNQLKKKELPFN